MEGQTKAKLLYPNFGGEEGKTPGDLPRGIRLLPTLWSALFDRTAELEGSPAVLLRGFLADTARAEPAIPQLAALDRFVSWYPNRQAEDLARRRGLSPAGPSADIVGRVHDKAFSVRLLREHSLAPEGVAASITILEPDDLRIPEEGAKRVEGCVASWPAWMQRKFFLKPRLGTSGRGKVVGDEGTLGRAARQRLPGFVSTLGAVVEPWLDRRSDLSVQLWISRDGRVTLLGTTRQLVTESGVYRGNLGTIPDAEVGPTHSGTEHDDEITRVGLLVARAAAREGFWGPCGIDSFTYLDDQGIVRLRSLVEFNARFTVGTIALGILARAREEGLTEGMGSWCFRIRAPKGGWPARPREEESRLLLLDADGLAAEEKPGLLLAPSLDQLDRELALISG